jgi:toxin ParE1/3/4
MRLLWTGPALSDLRALRADVAKDGERAADALVARIVDRAERQLSRLPDSGSPLPSLPRTRGREGRGKARELVISGTPYVLPYRVIGDAVHILRVFHSARRWPDEA